MYMYIIVILSLFSSSAFSFTFFISSALSLFFSSPLSLPSLSLSVGLTLSSRLEYISRAVMCAKSCGSVSSVSGEGEFLHELEEKMEVRKKKEILYVQCYI